MNDQQPLGTVVIDERIGMIVAVELRVGEIIFVAEFDGPWAGAPAGSEYRMHGDDGTQITRSRLDAAIPDAADDETLRVSLHMKPVPTGDALDG